MTQMDVHSRRASTVTNGERRTDARDSLLRALADNMKKLEEKEEEVINLQADHRKEVAALKEDLEMVSESWSSDKKELNDLKDKLMEELTRVAELQKQVMEQQELRELTRQEMQRMEGEHQGKLAQANDRQREGDATQQRLQQDIDSQAGLLLKQKRELESLQTETKQLQLQNDRLNEEKLSLSAELQMAQQQLESVGHERASLEQELQQQVTRLRSSEEQGARLSAELSAAGTQMEAGLEQQRELAARHEGLMKEAAALQEERSRLRARVEELVAAETQAGAQRDGLQKELQEERELRRKEAEELQAQLDVQHQATAAAERGRQGLDEELREVRDAKASSEAASRQVHGDLEAKVASLEEQREFLRSELSTITEQKNQQTLELKKLQDNYEALESAKKRLEEAKTASEDERQKVSQQLSEAQAAMAALEASSLAERREREQEALEKVAALDKRNAETEHSREQQSVRNRELEQQLAQLQKDVEQLQKELTLKDEKLQLQEANLKESYTRQLQLDQELLEERPKGQQLARQIEELTAERCAIELERDELTETLEATKQELDEVLKARIAAESDFAGKEEGLRGEMEEVKALLKKEREAVESERDALSQHLGLSQEELRQRSAEVSRLDEESQALRAERDSLTEALGKAQETMRAREAELSAEAQKLEVLREEHAQLTSTSQQEKLRLEGLLSDAEVAYEQKLAQQEEQQTWSVAKLEEQHLLERTELERRLQETTRSLEEQSRAKAGQLESKVESLEKELGEVKGQAERLEQEKVEALKDSAQAQSRADQLLGETRADYETRLLENCRALAEMEEAYRKVEALHKTCIRELQAAEERLQEKEQDVADKTAHIKVLTADIADQEAKTAQLRCEVEEFQSHSLELDRAIVELKSANDRRISQLQADKDRAEQMVQQLRKDLDELDRDKDQLLMDKEQMRRSLAHEKQEMSKKTELLSKEYEKKLEENDSKVSQTMAQWRSERDRLSEEKAEMNRRMEAYHRECEEKMRQDENQMLRRMESFRAECDQRMKQEQAAMAKMTQELHDKAHEQVAREQQAAERRLAEIRAHTEEQLRSEREVSDSVRHVLRELPPLQAAMELGDLASLEMELTKWRGQVLSERFGDCKGVVEAVVNMAKERLVTWRGVDHTWKEVIREVERAPSNLSSLTNQCQRLFRALKEAQLTKMDMRRNDPASIEKALDVLLAWKAKAMVCNNSVQALIVRKVMNCSQLGAFDFADLDICLRLVDRSEGGANQVFLSRAKVLVEDENVAPKDLKALLAHIETMLFFLKYAKSEDLSLTHAEFRKQAPSVHPSVAGYLDWAQQQYRPGKELVDLTQGQSLMDNNDVNAVLNAMRPTHSPPRGLDIFREIFYQWALRMRKQFNLLVLPHHTQVVCLLAFQRFLEAPSNEIRALVAQVGTGEGKSMIVAALAIYVVVALKKKVHVVVDDETLLDRDFASFKKLFEAFTVEENGQRRPLKAMLCVSEERLQSSKTKSGKSARVDSTADICYCEAKHVQSFYASIARSEHDARDFDSYAGRVLILDEVDALVIDEEPNEPFVYPNKELSHVATAVAKALSEGASSTSDTLARLRGGHPASARVVHEVVKEWERGQKMVAGEDFVYSKETGRYCALQAGRANPKAWSLALECRNFKDSLSKEIYYQERLFVMSRPRVFRRYHRILGLSGSIGNEPERRFLKETYRAAFFEVPPFLKTCRGSPFHEPLPAKLGSAHAPIYVEDTVEAQSARIAEVAMEARERVPVLIIARDRVHADQLVETLQHAARSRGLGAASEDVVRSLSRTLYEAEPEQWKENLNRATMSVGEAEGRHKSWRVTVTDRRGGRGTDYRVDDSDVDGGGGLLLIPAVVPTSQREWTQFLGRTARQDRRGQYCAVLCAKDYAALSGKYKESLPTGGCGLKPVQMILNWGDLETAERITGSAALYNCGVRVNELCEEVFGKRPEILRDPHARERLVDVCQRLRWMSVSEVDEAFARLPNFDPKAVPSEARDLGRPEVPPVPTGSMLLPPGSSGPSQVVTGGAKVVIFCLDWSASMKSNDTRTALNRFQTCVQCILRILRDQVRDNDLVGVVCFGPNVQTIISPTPKGQGGRMLQTRIASLTPSNAGGTCFYDAVLECLRTLSKPNLVPDEAARWLVCLTDGDDLGSSRPNARGEMVSQMLAAGDALDALNMVMITVGTLKSENVQVIQSWVKQVSSQGGRGVHLGDKDASGIAKAFEVVAEFLAAETGGATEC